MKFVDTKLRNNTTAMNLADWEPFEILLIIKKVLCYLINHPFPNRSVCKKGKFKPLQYDN